MGLKKEHKIFLIVGTMAIIFPVVLVFGERIIFNSGKRFLSISDYYHSQFRYVYLGFIAITSVLISQIKSFENPGKNVARWAGIFELIAIFFPTIDKNSTVINAVSGFSIYSNIIHNLFASLFFILITYINFHFFRIPFKKAKKPILPGTFIFISTIMLVSMILVASDYFFHDLLPQNLRHWPFKIIFEWIWLWSMGISWLIYFFNIKTITQKQN